VHAWGDKGVMKVVVVVITPHNTTQRHTIPMLRHIPAFYTMML
jgi:hypothetical protein